MKQGNLNGYLQKNIIHFVQNKKTNNFKSILVRRLANMGCRDLIPPYHILRHSPFPLGPAVQGKCFQGLVLTSGAQHPLSNIPQFSHLTPRFPGCGIVDIPLDLEFKDFP